MWPSLAIMFTTVVLLTMAAMVASSAMASNVNSNAHTSTNYGCPTGWTSNIAYAQAEDRNGDAVTCNKYVVDEIQPTEFSTICPPDSNYPGGTCYEACPPGWTGNSAMPHGEAPYTSCYKIEQPVIDNHLTYY
jgi:hypothetical protein